MVPTILLPCNPHPPAFMCVSCVAKRMEWATPPPEPLIGGNAPAPRQQRFVYREPEIPHRGKEGEYGLYCLCTDCRRMQLETGYFRWTKRQGRPCFGIPVACLAGGLTIAL